MSVDAGVVVERELAVMRWGLVPFLAKDAKMAFNTINAKAETITPSTWTS